MRTIVQSKSVQMRSVVAGFATSLLRDFSPISDQRIWAFPGILLVIDFAWGSQVGLSVGGIEWSVGAIVILLSIAVIYRHRSRAIADMAAAAAPWLHCGRAGLGISTYLRCMES